MTQIIENVWLYADAHAPMNAATGVALEISKLHGTALTIVGAVERPRDPFLRTPLGQEMVQLVRDDRQQRLRALEEQARNEVPQLTVSTVLLDAEVAWQALTSRAIEFCPDLVILPAGGGASVGAFGTLSQHLFRKCPAPVWSVLGDANRLLKRALVAVDPGPEGSDKRRLSQGVVQLATALAAHTGMELHLGHAWSLFDERLLTARFGATGTQPYLDSQLQYARDMTDQLLRPIGGQEKLAAIHYPRGEAGVAIPALAEEIDADVVILGSAVRGGIEGFFVGSVAETILSRLQRSAIVVKRPGFISPAAREP